MAAASSSSLFFGIREEENLNHHLKQQQMPPQASSTIPSSSSNLQGGAAAPPKKKRNLPGNPNPDAEVIALSPNTLMATNRFICEVCNKGFQREQNLQLHRRGHNLPWKLKQKSNKEVRRRVYLCPEQTCVHHDPSRALGDLTGIKKHFCRKHGEKKWKCDKCSKRYAVQSDWKAHSKTCGTREYRCDCGTLFSRRDSFITHRAFCDALAQESARIPNLSSTGHLYSSSAGGGGPTSINLGLSQLNPHHSAACPPPGPADLLRLGDHHLPPSSFRPALSHPHPPSSFFLSHDQSSFQNKPFMHTLMQLPDLQHNNNISSAASNSTPINLFHQTSHPHHHHHHPHLMMMQHDQFPSNVNVNAGAEPSNLIYDQMFNSSNSSIQNDPVNIHLPQMSATALLQKAAQMGATSSNNNNNNNDNNNNGVNKGFGSSSSARTTSLLENGNHNLQDIMSSFADGNSGMFAHHAAREEQDAKFGDYNAAAGFCNLDEGSTTTTTNNYHNNGNFTRDFLGVGSMLRSMGGAAGISSSQREHHHHHHGTVIDHISGSLDSHELKPASSSRSFASGALR